MDRRRLSAMQLTAITAAGVAFVSTVGGVAAWWFRSSGDFWTWPGWLAIGALGTLTLALVTFALAASTAFLAAQTRRDVDAQYQPVIVGADVGLRVDQVDIEMANGCRLVFHLENAGRGVALSAICTIHSDLRKNLPRRTWSQATGITIPAGASRLLEVTIPRFWSDQNLRDADSNLHAEIRYLDVAGNVYRTYLVANWTAEGRRFKIETFNRVTSLRPPGQPFEGETIAQTSGDDEPDQEV